MAADTESKPTQLPPARGTGMSSGKRVAIGVNVVVQILILTLIFLIVNGISFRRFARWDFTRDQKFALSTQTKSLLGSLQKPAKAIIYFAGSGAAGQIFPDVNALLKEYEYASGRKMTVETVDVYQNLSRAQELSEKYKFGGEENVVILDYDDRSKFVNANDMADMEQVNPMMPTQPRVLAFKGEAAITTALLELVEGKPKKLYLTTGHGESEIPSIEPGKTDQAFVLGQMLKRSNIKNEPLNLLDSDRIPEDATALMLFGPRQDLSEREIQLLDSFWNNKGHLLVFLHGSARTPRLNAWLAGIGVKPLGGPIVAQVSTINLQTGQRGVQTVWDGAGVFSRTATTILRDKTGTNIQFFGSTTGFEIDKTKADTQITSLAESVKQFWLELDPITGPAVPSRDPVREKEGPFTLAVSVEKGGVEGLKLDTSRMIVVANAGFLTDGGLQTVEAGLDFGLNSINWLMNRDKGPGVGIPPKEKKFTSLTLDDAGLKRLGYPVVLGLPAIVAFFGIISWFQRRR
jgi:hypothetical protein